MDVSGGESKVRCCKEQYCIQTWNARSVNQGESDVGSTAIFLKNDVFLFGCAGSSLLCRLFSSCGKRGFLLGAVHRLLLRWLLLLRSTGAKARGPNSCSRFLGSRAQAE